jgi:hypothetical protein
MTLITRTPAANSPKSKARVPNFTPAARFGTQLIQELISDGCHGVTRRQPTTEKSSAVSF